MATPGDHLTAVPPAIPPPGAFGQGIVTTKLADFTVSAVTDTIRDGLTTSVERTPL